MNTHEFKPISTLQGHLCGVMASDGYCGYPASADVHMPATSAPGIICPTCQVNFPSYPEFTSHIGNPTCANKIIASPATEDRATARYATRRDPSGSGLLLENDNVIAELETTDAAFAMAIKLDAYTASQKRIEALEAALTVAKEMIRFNVADIYEDGAAWQRFQNNSPKMRRVWPQG